MTDENELREPLEDVKSFFPPDFWEMMNDVPVIVPEIDGSQPDSEKDRVDRERRLPFFHRG